MAKTAAKTHVYTFYYFYIPVGRREDSAELKSRNLKGENVFDAERKFDNCGSRRSLTREVYRIEQDGVTVFTANEGYINIA